MAKSKILLSQNRPQINTNPPALCLFEKNLFLCEYRANKKQAGPDPQCQTFFISKDDFSPALLPPEQSVVHLARSWQWCSFRDAAAILRYCRLASSDSTLCTLRTLTCKVISSQIRRAPLISFEADETIKRMSLSFIWAFFHFFVLLILFSQFEKI